MARETVASGFATTFSQTYWACDCSNMIRRGEEFAIRLLDNEEMCMECYEDETKFSLREGKK